MIIFIFVSYKPMRFVLFSEMKITTKPYRKEFYFAARGTKRRLTKHAKVSLIVLNHISVVYIGVKSSKAGTA
jgi:hypothetical protein